MLKVEAFTIHNVIRDGRGGNAKHVGNDSIKGHIADGEHVLITVFLAGVAGNKLEAITHKFPQDTDCFTGDEAAGNRAYPKRVANPFGIFGLSRIAGT